MLQSIEDKKIGKFEYDDTLWKVVEEDGYAAEKTLRWIGGNQRCDLPKGCISCDSMFKEATLGEGFMFGDFDTSNVNDMSSMFENAILPDDFHLGSSFKTSNVLFMFSMFAGVKFAKGLDLGPFFNTRKVSDMTEMFAGTTINYSLHLGDDFYTRSDTMMDSMFEGCKIGKACYLGDHFVVGRRCENMFTGCVVDGIDYTGLSPEDAVHKMLTMNPLGAAEIREEAEMQQAEDDEATYKDLAARTFKWMVDNNPKQLDKFCDEVEKKSGKRRSRNIIDPNDPVEIAAYKDMAARTLKWLSETAPESLPKFEDNQNTTKKHSSRSLIDPNDPEEVAAYKDVANRTLKWLDENSIERSELDNYKVAAIEALKWLEKHPVAEQDPLPFDIKDPEAIARYKESVAPVLKWLIEHLKQTYDFTKLLFVPEASLKFCKSISDVLEIIDKYCKP